MSESLETLADKALAGSRPALMALLQRAQETERERDKAEQLRADTSTRLTQASLERDRAEARERKLREALAVALDWVDDPEDERHLRDVLDSPGAPEA